MEEKNKASKPRKGLQSSITKRYKNNNDYVSRARNLYGEKTRGTNEQAERAAAAEKEQMEKFIEGELNNNRGRMGRD